MSDTMWMRLSRGVQRLRQRADWSGFVGGNWSEKIMTAAITDRFHAKQGRSTGRWILKIGDRRLAVYLKRHYRLPWWQGLLATLWPQRDWSPALQEWNHLERARLLGLPVPATVAAAEYIGPWGRLRSCLAVEELADMLPLHEAIPMACRQLDPATFGDWKRGLTREVARIARTLHGQRWFHKDLYLCHFYVPINLIRPADFAWRGQVHVIDLHRLGHHPWMWRVWQIKDLAELLYSSEVEGVNDRDRQRFWLNYHRGDSKSPTQALLRRFILWKWQRYRRHNAKKKSSLVISH